MTSKRCAFFKLSWWLADDFRLKCFEVTGKTWFCPMFHFRLPRVIVFRDVCNYLEVFSKESPPMQLDSFTQFSKLWTNITSSWWILSSPPKKQRTTTTTATTTTTPTPTPTPTPPTTKKNNNHNRYICWGSKSLVFVWGVTAPLRCSSRPHVTHAPCGVYIDSSPERCQIPGERKCILHANMHASLHACTHTHISY